MPNNTVMDIESETRFSTIDPLSLKKLMKTKDHKWLRDHGGVEGIVSALESDVENGITGHRADIDGRRKIFGHNLFPEYKFVFWLKHFGLEAAKDPMIIILGVCALISLVFGVIRHGGFQEGAWNLVSILIVAAVSTGSNLWPMSLCLKYSDISSYMPQVDVVRNGKWQQMPIPRIVVGDVVFLKPGDHVPADGLFLDGCSLQVENSTTVEDIDSHENPFLFSGSSVVDGYARMLVTAVGKHKNDHFIHFKGTLVDELKNLTSVVRRIGFGVAMLTFLIFLARLFGGDLSLHDDKDSNLVDFVFVMVGITATPAMIALTSSPEGLLLAVKVTIAYSMRRLKHAKVLVRKPSICDSVASVTTICVNKTGTLTLDQMEVTKFWVGLSTIEEVPHSLIAPNIIELLHQGIGLNTCQPPSRSLSITPNNSTEKAIFEWAVQQLKMDIETVKKSCSILEIEPFNSKSKQSGVLISKNADNSIHVHRKGAAEVIIPMCSHYYESTGIVKVINKSTKELLEQILEGMSQSGLRCIGFAHRKTSIRDYFTFSRQQLILLGIVGLTNVRRSGIKLNIAECKQAGVQFKLITGDNISTAKFMAENCSILESDYQPDEIVEGEVFRNYTSEERMERVESIRVMARATPFDKFLMVQSLKQKGHVVACLGRGVGDVQAIREADVGICFGIKAAETIISSSSLFVSNKEFQLVVDILRWGRSTYDNIETYTQFLLTATFVGLVLDFVMAISSSEPPGFNAVAEISAGKVPYPVFQLLWLKLILGILGVAAIAVKHPSEELLQKPRRNRNEPVMTGIMLRTICAQTIYQTILLLTIHYRGKSIFKLNGKEKDTMILNTYIICQLFSIFNPRLFQKNIFEDMHKKKLLWGILGITMTLQVLLVEVLKRFTGTVSLSWGKWGISICIASMTLPLNWLIKYIVVLKKPSFNNFNWLGWKSKIE